MVEARCSGTDDDAAGPMDSRRSQRQAGPGGRRPTSSPGKFSFFTSHRRDAPSAMKASASRSGAYQAPVLRGLARVDFLSAFARRLFFLGSQGRLIHLLKKAGLGGKVRGPPGSNHRRHGRHRRQRRSDGAIPASQDRGDRCRRRTPAPGGCGDPSGCRVASRPCRGPTGCARGSGTLRIARADGS
jgi:hypothetical protein